MKPTETPIDKLDPIPSPDTYSRWKGWSGKNFGEFSKIEARYFAWQFRRLKQREAPHRVLEIGFGNGNFLGWAQGQGHACQGIELNDHLVRKAREHGFAAFADLSELKADEPFDILVAFDVLEHIPLEALPAFVSELRSHLVPGGRMLFRFPNGDSPFGRPIQYGDLSHTTVLGSGRLDQLCELCGLQVREWGEPPWYVLHPNRPLQGLTHAASRWFLERLFRKLFYKRRISLNPNLVVILQNPVP